MKIIILNNLYFPYQKGGAEQYILEQVERLEKENNQVIIISTQPSGLKKVKRRGQVYYLKSLYSSLNQYPKIFRFFWHLKQLIIPTNKRQIKKILLEEKPDLAITHNLLGLSWSIPRLLKKLKIKHQHTLHDIQLLHPSGLMYYGQEKIINQAIARLYQSLTRNYFKGVKKISSPSRWLFKLHQEQGFFQDCELKKQSFNPENFPKILWPREIRKLLFVGQLERHKGILFLIDYLKKRPLLSLSIIGEGRLRSKIIDDEQISYLGKLSKKEIFQEMKKHDCLIVPSICYENIPLVIIEASSVGLATIASNIGGIGELKNIFNLKLFTPNDYQSLDKIIESDEDFYQPEEQK